jgi:hypothetical protein
METEMRNAENTSDIRSLTDAELDDVSGGVLGDAILVGLFLIGVSIGAYWDLPAKAPRNLDQLYGSW